MVAVYQAATTVMVIMIVVIIVMSPSTVVSFVCKVKTFFIFIVVW